MEEIGPNGGKRMETILRKRTERTKGSISRGRENPMTGRIKGTPRKGEVTR